MKIAVASTGSHVARHFALCESFHIYMVYGGKIMKETDIPNPGLRPAMLPEFLEKQKVNAVICGGLGGRTEELFREKGIYDCQGYDDTGGGNCRNGEQPGDDRLFG